jgi:hypothetical protein
MTPSEEHLCFYHELGLAVTQWASVEQGIYWIALRSFEEHESHVIGPAFFSIENFRSKLAFVDAAFEAKFGGSIYAEHWASIRDEVLVLASARNRLVHYHLAVMPKAKPGRRYFLHPTVVRPEISKFGQRPGHNRAPSGALFLKDIYRDARRFATASNKLLNLWHILGGREGPFGQDVLKEKPIPQLPQLVRQMRTLLGQLR